MSLCLLIKYANCKANWYQLISWIFVDFSWSLRIFWSLIMSKEYFPSHGHAVETCCESRFWPRVVKHRGPRNIISSCCSSSAFSQIIAKIAYSQHICSIISLKYTGETKIRKWTQTRKQTQTLVPVMFAYLSLWC